MKSVTTLAAFVSIIACGLSFPQAQSQTKLSNTWSSAGQLTQARSGAAAVQLIDGRVLITGGTDANGVPQATAEVYNPATSVFSAVPSMNVPRANHAAILLETGDALVTGGLTSGGGYSDSAEIYNFKTQAWTLVSSSMSTGLAGHTMVLLPDGNVLIAGGASTAKVVSSIVLFNTASQTFTPISSLLTARTNAVAAATPDGRVLIAGGADINGAVLASTEIFTYSKDTMTGTIAAGPAMTSAREYATATTTYDGVAVIGGNNGHNDLGTAEIFSQWTNKFKVVTGGTPRSHHFAVLLPKNGSILAMGGTGGAKVDLLEPWANSTAGAFLAAPDSLENQDGGFASPGGLGSMLAAGGTGKNATSAELYSFPTVSTQNREYAPGTKVEMSGTGFQPFEAVELHIHEWVNQSTEDDPDATVTADALGNFSYDGYSPDSADIGARYHLTAVGQSSGYQAQTIFGDSINAIDFFNPPLYQNTGACGALTLTVGGSAPYGDIYFTDSTTTGAFYSDSGCTTALPTASYQLYPGGPTYVDPYIAGAATVTVYYSNTTAGNPQLTACASEDPYACYIPPPYGAAEANQTETIFGPLLGWKALPSGGASGVAFATQPQVEVLSSSGTLVTSSTAPITLTLMCPSYGGYYVACGTNGTTGTLTCNGGDTLSATAGVATFSGCYVTVTGQNTQFCLVASSPGISPSSEACFSVTAISVGPGGESTVTANPGTVPADGVSTSTITVTLQDTQGNAVPNKTITLTQTGASVICYGTTCGTTASGFTDGNGVAIFTVTDTTVQNVTYTATDTTDSNTVIGTVQVTFSNTGTTLLLAAPSAPNPPTGTTATPETLTATLTDTATGAPIANASVTFTISGTGSAGCTVLTNASGVATCAGTAAASTVVGTTYTVGATFATATVGGVTYATAAGSPAQYITVGGTLPTLAFSAPSPFPTSEPYNTEFTVAAGVTPTADHGAITYSVTGACTDSTNITGSTRNVLMQSGTGTCYVTASIAEYCTASTRGVCTAAYGAATVTKAVTGTKLTPTIAIPPGGVPSSAGDESTFAVPYQLSGYPTGNGVASPTGAVTFAVTGNCTVSGTTVTMTASTGQCSITATIAADLNYNSATSAPVVVVAATGTGTVVVTCSNFTYNGTAPTNPCSATTTPSGLEVDFTYNGSATVPTNAGTYTVVGTINDPNYQGTGTAGLTISPAPVTATAVGITSFYTGSPITISSCSVTGSYVGPLTCTGSPSTETNVGSGTVVPVVSYGGDLTTNYSVTSVDSTWTINQASSSVALTCPSPETYTGSAITTCTAVTTNTNTPTDTSATDSSLTPTIQYANNINVGTAAAVATFLGNANVAPSSSTLATFTITALPATIMLSNLTEAYTGNQATVGVTTNPVDNATTGLPLTWTITYSSATYPASSTPPVEPGSYTVVATITDPDYAGSTGNQVLTIGPITPAMILSLDPGDPAAPFLYGSAVSFDLDVNNGTPPPPCPSGKVQFYVNGVASGSQVTLDPTSCNSSVFYQIATLPLGTDTIYAIYTGDANYPQTQSNTLTETVTADATTVSLVSTAGTIPINVGGVVTFTATVDPSPSIDSGASGPGGTVSFYECLVSTPPPPTTCDSSNGTLMGTAQPLSTTSPYTAQLVNPPLAAGTWAIGAVYTSTDNEFTGSSSTVLLTVVNLNSPNIVWPTPDPIVYGTALSATQLDAQAQDPNTHADISGTYLYSPAVNFVPDAGSVNLNVSFTPDDTSTYSGQTGSVTLAVLKATLTVTADPQTMTFGGTVPTLTYTITGCVNGDSCDATNNPVWTGTATCTTTATSTSPVGGYPITCDAGSTLLASNYTFTYVPGILQVTAVTTLTITTPPIASNITYGQTLVSSVLTGGTAMYNGTTVPGTFAWTTPTQVEPAGTASYPVIFTATDAADYNTAPGTASVTVLKATPAVTQWPTAAAISLGQPLSASALGGNPTATYNGTAVPGTFAWTTPTTVPPAPTGGNTDAESVTFTPTDATDYNTVAGTVLITVNNLKTPTITTLPTATALTYGQPLSASTLASGVASYNGTTLTGTWAWTNPATVPGAGADPESITFTPSDTINYNTATGTVTVNVAKATPTIGTPPTASQIYVGQTLAASLLSGGSATNPYSGAVVFGTFAWTTSTTTPAAGADPEGVTFTPSDTTDYIAATTTVTITVNNKVPTTITTLPTASAIIYGQTLAASVLSNGVGSVPGAFAWTNPLTVPGAGADPEGVTFTPSNTTEYNPVTGTVTVTVSKATPTITTPPTATAISSGQTLAASTLGGGVASVPGTFAWTTPTTIPPVGNADVESVTFTPTITTNYNTVTFTVTVTVNNKKTPTITTLPTASGLTYGQALFPASTLTNGVASYGGTALAGTWAWTNPATVPGAGADPESITFTPTDTTDYNTVSGTVTVTVAKATPTVSVLPTASAISNGQTLAASTLTLGTATYNSATVLGTFAWTTPTTAPPVGADPESVTFTPTDATDYNTATATVTVTVNNKATPTITTLPTASAIVYGQTLAASVLTPGVASVPGTWAWTNSATIPGAGADPESVTFTPADTTNYNTASGTVTVTVSKATPTVTAWPTPSTISPGKTLVSSTLVGGAASYNGTTVPGTFTWTAPATIPAAGTDVESVTFTPTDAIDYNTVIGTVSVTVNNKTTPTVTTWPTAAAITYGQTLASSTLTGGTASVAGTFAWTTPTTAPATGADAESITFTPTDTADYNTVTNTVKVTVSKATPKVTAWPTAAALSIGQALSASALTGGTASVAGTFAWTTPATVPVAGADSESVTFTPTDTTDYNTVTGTVTVRVGNKTTPTVTAWPTAGVIYIGQTLASSVLTGGTASVAGTFAWTAPTTAPPVGTDAEGVTFTPTDTTDYNTVAGTVKVTVNTGTRVLTVSANSQSRTYGATNSALTYAITGLVNGDTLAVVSGKAACTTTAAPTSAVGKYPITCTQGTLSATNYTFQFISGSLTVTAAPLTLVADDVSRVYGDANPVFTGKVTGAVNGDKFTESFTTSAITSSKVGTYSIVPSVTGTNLADYDVTAQKGVLTITQADTTTSVKASSSSVNPGQSVTLTAKVVSATTGTPTGSVSFYDGTTLLGTETLASGTATFSTSSLTAGTTDTIAAVYSGDDNFITSFGSTSVTEASLDFTLAISGAASANINQGSAATYQIAIKPLYGSYPGPVTFTTVGAPSSALVTFSPSTVEANGGNTTVTLTIKTNGSANLAPADTGSKRSPLAWALVLIPLLGLSRLRRQGRRLSRLATLLLLLGCTLAGALVTGCGSSVSLIEHDYSIVVTATSGNVKHNVPVTLDVK